MDERTVVRTMRERLEEEPNRPLGEQDTVLSTWLLGRVVRAEGATDEGWIGAFQSGP